MLLEYFAAFQGEGRGSMDQVFEEEQQQLTVAYAKLEAIAADASAKLAATSAEAAQQLEDFHQDQTLDTMDSAASETLVELEAMNRQIEEYSRVATVVEDRLNKANLLLRQPYFAKVTLKFKGSRPPRDVYLGAAGMVDETHRHFIVDWRSPVAEVYYNQSNGKTSYKANGRTIECDLLVRRQFDIARDKLKACFDTTVAIEDPLLLAALGSRHSEKLKAITATIQKEQNEVVRHEDVPVLLVDGIAGSGKTSVLLQRIAYLFYQRREDLRPDQVYLLTPNAVFGRYIDDVLPNMGERNPHILTWASFVEQLGLADRGLGFGVSARALHALREGMGSLRLEQRDFREIVIDGARLLKVSQVQGAVAKYAHVPLGPRFAALVVEDLHERLDRRLAQMATDEHVQDAMLSLDIDSQVSVFGSAVAPSTDEEVLELARQYVQATYFDRGHEAVENLEWLRFDRIGMRMNGADTMSAPELIYLRGLFAGTGNRDARYVMIDEVQDYTEAQLMALARFFGNANFLLLGDENQAIRPGTASFAQIRAIFGEARGNVDECSLLTSYRSSPEVTALFTSLMPEDKRVQVTSVQHEGEVPRIVSYGDADQWKAALVSLAEDAVRRDGLTAIVAQDGASAHSLAKWLPSACPSVHVMRDTDSLPGSGVVLMDLRLAKGLEFDMVVIPDATADRYPDDDLHRRRLYTALSRATHRVAVLANGPLTPLLKVR